MGMPPKRMSASRLLTWFGMMTTLAWSRSRGVEALEHHLGSGQGEGNPRSEAAQDIEHPGRSDEAGDRASEEASHEGVGRKEQEDEDGPQHRGYVCSGSATKVAGPWGALPGTLGFGLAFGGQASSAAALPLSKAFNSLPILK